MTTPTKRIFGRFPRTLDDLHQIWTRYNDKPQSEPFGAYMLERFARKNTEWNKLANMSDNWEAYHMVAELYK